MTGPELNRKYWELCGWWFESYGNGGGYWHKKQHPGKSMRKIGAECDCSTRLLPDLHVDANLALAEAAKVFLGGWNIEETGGIFNFIGYDEHEFERKGESNSEHAFCEAILKALIAAKGATDEH